MATNNQSLTEPSTPLRSISREDSRIGYYSNPLRFGVHLPPYELPALTARLGLRSVPGSRGSRPTTPNTHGTDSGTRRSRISTPTRVNYADEVRNKRRRRSSIIINQKGEAVYDPNYVGPITIDYLKFFCKVVVKERERVIVPEPVIQSPQDQNNYQSQNQDNVQREVPHLPKSPQQGPIHPSHASLIAKEQDFDQSLPIPNSSGFLQSPIQLYAIKDSKYPENILEEDHNTTPPHSPQEQQEEESPRQPKTYSYLEKILLARKLKTKSLAVTDEEPIRTPIRKVLDPQDSDEDKTKENKRFDDNQPLSKDETHSTQPDFTHSSQIDKDHTNELIYEAEQYTEPAPNNTPPHDTLIERPELSGSTISNVVTPQTMFSDSLYPENYPPPILMQEEYTTDNQTNEVLEHFLAIDDDIDEQIEHDTILPNHFPSDDPEEPNNRIHSELDDNEVLPGENVLIARRENALSEVRPLLRIPKQSSTVASSNSVIPLRTVKTLVKSVVLHNSDKKTKPISKDIYNLLQEKSEEFLGTLVSDLEAYASHRSNNHGSQINMKDLFLYLRRVKHRDDDNTTELERISKLAQNFLPLELLIELDNTLRGSNDIQLTMENEDDESGSDISEMG